MCMKSLRAYLPVFVLALVTSSFADLPEKTLESIRDQLKAKNPKLVAGSVIKVTEAEATGHPLEKVGTPISADYQTAQGDCFRYELYLYRSGKLERLDHGLMGTRWIATVWGKDGLYYSFGGGSGVYRCTVGKLVEIKGKLQKTEFDTENDLDLRLQQSKVIAGLDVSSADSGFKALGELKIVKGKLCVVDSKGKAIDVSKKVKTAGQPAVGAGPAR